MEKQDIGVLKEERRGKRLVGVDAFRTLAILFVIIIHTSPFDSPSSPLGKELNLATILNQFARFAVPYFFIISGYFWGRKTREENRVFQPTITMMKRISFLFIAWSIIYLFPMNIIDVFADGPAGLMRACYLNSIEATSHPFITLMQGVHDHLWFLMGLLCSLAIASVLIRFNLQMLLIAAAVMLYGTALLGGPYSASPLGFHANFNFRNGPFFSLLFFVTGYLLQRRTSRMRWASIGLLLVFFGICLSIFELTIIKNYWGTTMCQDYVIGTYPFGLGIALIALSNFGHSKMRLPASVAPMVLGIYVSHYGFIMMLHPLDRLLAVKTTWEIFQTVLVFYLAFAATRLFSKYKITQKLVS